MRIRFKVRPRRAVGSWAMGALMAYSATGARPPAAAFAQAVHGPVSSLRFEIPTGPLDGVLRAFETATGWKITVIREGIRGVASPGVTGLHTPEDALRRLLADTGIVYRLTGPLAASLDVIAVSTTVDVTDSVAALAISSPKYAEPLLDTPQTITAVPRRVMDEQGVTTLRDALRNVAGISLAAGEGGAQGDNLTVRGFTARNDLYIDGMRDFGSYYRDPFNTEEVDVLQGPSSVTFGRGSTGGVVNQAYKVPNAARAVSGDLDFGTDRTRRLALDINTPLRSLGDGAAFRLNLMGHQGNVAGRDIAENRRYGIAPSLALGLDGPTRLTLSYFRQAADDIPDYGIPWLQNGPAPVNRRNYYGFAQGSYLRTNADIGTAKVERDFGGRITLRSQARYASYRRDTRITAARIAGDGVDRNQIAARSAETYLGEQTDLSARFETGFVRHSLVAGIEAGRETSDPTRFRYTGVPGTSLYDPNPYQEFAGTAAVSSRVNATGVSAAAYVLDTLSLNRHWEVSAGVRWDRFDTDYRQSVAPAAAFSRLDRMTTWRAALVYKPALFGSVYFAAGTSANPSAESLSLSAGNANLPPEKSRSLELGSKWDLSRGRLSLRGALFRTEKTNAREPDPANPLLNVLAGEHRVKGGQVEVRGRLASRWEMMASYALLDAHLASSRYYPAAVGARLANVPRHTFGMWNTFRLPWQVQFGLGGNYVGLRTASSTAPYDPATGLLRAVPGYWNFNAMARRPLGEHADLQVNVVNLTNRYYYDQLHPGHIVPGAGRSALAGIRFKF